MNGQLPIVAGTGAGSSSLDLYITHVDYVGPYLKVYGQANRDAAFLVSTRIEQLVPTCFAIDPSWSMERQQALLTPGTFCVYKNKKGPAPGDTEYMRSRVINAEQTNPNNMRVEIEMLDYGYKRNVNSRDLLFSKQPKLLQNTPLLCSQYILIGIVNEWEKPKDMEVVRKLILNQMVHLTIDPTQICGQKFATIRWMDFDLTEYLLEQEQIGCPVSRQLTFDHCKSMWKDVGAPVSPQMEYNNNSVHSTNSSPKTPTDLAREQLAARRSLAARLEQQRAVPTTPLRQLNVNAIDYAPKQQTAAPQHNSLGNMVLPPLARPIPPHPPQVMANIRANLDPPQETNNTALPYVAKTNPRSVYNLYNVRMNKPAQNQPFGSNTQPAAMGFAPARFTPPPTQAQIQVQTVIQQQPQRIIPAFRTTSLTVGLTYDVYVSFVENGPHLFWVQLKSSTNELDKMMGQIEKMRLQPLGQSPEVGTACVARFSEDGNCYRALVSAIYGQRYRVVYVDYGNSEMVNSNDLFQIPQELLGIKPFAFRFALNGAKVLEPIDESMKRIFKSSALYINFQLTVQAPESVGAMQTCHLNGLNGNMLDILKKLKNSRQSYAKAEQLLNDDNVEIRFIDSPSNFYVQKVDHIKKFELLMDEMFVYYNVHQVVPDQLILGAPCIVKCDQEWYRAEVLRVDEPAIIVRHVDFGYEQKVKRHLISNIAEKHLQMPRQAIKCCLKGFENSELGQDKITDQFEMLAEDSNIKRRTFTVRVFRIEPDGLNVVNLLAKNLNVMKKLYKLSMPFEQYLSLEKGQFNATRGESEIEKGQILNSTTVESEDRMQLQKQVQQQQQQQQQRVKNTQDNNWDKRSSASASSKDTKEKRSLPPPKMEQRNLDSSFESSSISSFTSNLSSPRKAKRQNGHQQQEANKNARLTPNQSPRKEKDRSQNAPQGFAQKPQRQKSTLDGLNTKRSSGLDSDANSTESSSIKPEKYVPLDKSFTLQNIKTPSKESANLSWWVSPFQFYVVSKSLAAKYENLLQREMKQFYRQKPHQPLQLKVGSTVVVRQRKDQAILRATVSACNHMMRKYRVFCVDTGSLITVTSEDVWQLEQRFAEPPALAYRCSFHSVVTNYDHLYIVDRMDRYVPVNSKVECEFLSKQNENNCCIVNIFVNGASLRDMLVKAEFLTEVAPEIRVSLLAGQQVRGKFTSIRDMTSFKIQLDYCEVNFLCSFDDAKFVKSNPDLAKRFKEFYEGKSFAFNVKHVCENNIIHLRPVMPLLKEERNAFICGYPVVLSTFQARVVHTAKAYRVYVQPLSIETAMQKLLDDMFDYYEEQGKPLKKFEPGQICAARSADKNWYRARIIAKDLSADHIKVFYIDYGNTEELKRTDIKMLDEKFQQINKSGFSVEINLPLGKANNEAKLKSHLEELMEEQIVTVKPLEVRRNHIIADIVMENQRSLVDLLKADKLIPGKDVDYMRKVLEKEKPFCYEYIETVDLTTDDEEEVKEKATEEVKKEEIPPPTPQAKTPEPTPEPPKEDPYSHLKKAALSHCDNPAHFFVHPIDRLPELKHLQENLQIISPSLPKFSNLVNGAMCISLYSVDKSWYRAKILDAELMVLQFIDFGNTDCVSDATDIKESMWTHMEPFCMPFALPISPKGTNDWVDAANGIFNESFNKTLRYDLLTQGDHLTPSYVRLYIDEVDVAQKLIADGYAKPLEYVPSGSSCYVSHVNSISDFYIQLEIDSKALELLEMFLHEAEEKFKPVERFEKGQIVAAKFEEDDLWYRAQMLRELGDSRYEVLFIDYGNTSTTSKCLVLSEQLTQVQNLSKKCQLHLPENYANWSPEAEKKFAELTSEGDLVFTTQLVKPAEDTMTLHLLLDEENINERLLPLCQPKEKPKAEIKSLPLTKAIVTHVDQVSKLYLQFQEQDALIETIFERINDSTKPLKKKLTALVNDLCVVQFEQDKEFYRARILEILPQQKYRVFFLDYGNQTLTQDLYELPQELFQIEPIALEHSLEMCENFIKHKSLTHESLEALLDSCNGEVVVEYLNKHHKPPVVKLITKDNQGFNIFERLNQLLESKLKQKSSETNECIISGGNSPRNFYVQLKKHSAELDCLVKTLKSLKSPDNLPLLEDIMENLVCLCYASDDSCFYRAIIKSVLPEGILVFLMDYGNTLVVQKVFQLPEDLFHISPLALPCHLSEIPSDVSDKVLEEAFTSLMEVHFGEVYDLKQLSKDEEGVLTVQLSINYKDLAQELVNSLAGVQKPLEVELHNCFVVQYDSPSSFYVQMEQDVSALEQLTDQLLDAEQNLPPFTALKEGSLCVAQFPEDEVFYRAKIVKVLSEGKCEVHFIDFGNNAVTQQFRQLPSSMAHLPPYSKHCQLESATIAKCNLTQLQEFIDTRFSETFQLEILAHKGDTCVVRLFYQSTNISEKLRLQDKQQ